MSAARLPHRTITRLLVFSALAALALTAAGCGQDRVTYTPAHGSEHASENATDHMADTSAEGEFSPADIMFAEMMIAHHEQAIEMSDLAATQASDERVRGLATRIKAAQEPEIKQMQGWVDASGMGDIHAGDHSGMSGMLSEQQMTALRAARGAAFDRLFLTGMIEHHQGAIDMAAPLRESANNKVSDLANLIISAQTSEITEMQALLARLP